MRYTRRLINKTPIKLCKTQIIVTKLCFNYECAVRYDNGSVALAGLKCRRLRCQKTSRGARFLKARPGVAGAAASPATAAARATAAVTAVPQWEKPAATVAPSALRRRRAARRRQVSAKAQLQSVRRPQSRWPGHRHLPQLNVLQWEGGAPLARMVLEKRLAGAPSTTSATSKPPLADDLPAMHVSCLSVCGPQARMILTFSRVRSACTHTHTMHAYMHISVLITPSSKHI